MNLYKNMLHWHQV